ncbi:MAG: PDZ domain-containing protein [Phycisphaerales bacterium]
MHTHFFSRSFLLASICGTAVSLAAPAGADTSPHAGMMRFPDVSKDSIVFVYANDLWIVAREGGVARPLASPAGAEMMPRFSPDGRTVAFTGNYDGGRDIYTMPVEAGAGAVPVRVTHHPAAEMVSEWTPDGKILFISNGLAGLQRQSQLFTVAPGGGLPQRVPVPYGSFASVSPDGAWLAYIPHSTDFRTWKRYRGGMATDIWLFNLKDRSSRRATTWEGTDSFPMWVPGGDGRAMYFLSDAGQEHRLNIWRYDVSSGERTQVTTFRDLDVKFPSIGPGPGGKGEIVFQLGSELRLLDLATGQDHAVKVTIPGDRPTIRAHMVNAASDISGAGISPSGKRVVVDARGDLWSAPAKEGAVRQVTRTSGVFERDPAWSPDGKWIAYFSDETGEYELYIRSSDARPEEEKKKDGKADGKGGEKEGSKEEAKEGGKDGAGEEEAAAPRSRAVAGEVKKLTNLGPGFRSRPTWSPDSKHILFQDEAGRIQLTTVETGETRVVDTDPWSEPGAWSWSHDSGWIAYTKGDAGNQQGTVWVYNLKEAKATQVTGGMFASGSPAFDRKGEFLYFVSNRLIDAPIYSSMDTSFVYTGGEQVFALPLRKDVKSPLLPRSDEEELKKDGKKKDEKAEKKNGKDGDKKEEGSKDGGAKGDDGVSGSWSGTAKGGASMPPEGVSFTLKVRVDGEGKVTGDVTSPMGSGSVSGTFDRASGELVISFAVGEASVTMRGTVKDGACEGTWTEGQNSGTWSASRSSAEGGKQEGDEGKKDDGKKDEEKKDEKPLVIDLEGMEARAFALPIGRGSLGGLAVNSDGRLIYVRNPARGSGEPSAIKVFDPAADEKEEKNVVTGAGGFDMSADGKKLLVFKGGSMSVVEANAGGKSTDVPTAGMRTEVNPREEWKQVFMDTWRLFRDYFYEPTMHNVDWPGMRDRYMAMLDDCANREDVAYVQAELVSELNIGHAYITSPGDVENQPNVGVGMLGCDYDLANGAYRITRIYTGAAWDVDARGPLSQPGVGVKEGDYLLAVDGVPVDTKQDPWAAFIDTAGRVTTVTVGPNPVIDAGAHDVTVTPMGSEANLRFRAWVEANRQYVSQKTNGQVGYIYVPNTGVDGQNELFRQFFGQRQMPALLIDERWNGGGQIPTRFIELLARTPVNYWARRHGNDWPWPPDGHFGPKAMLINGLAGSGGDAFPNYFRQMGIGKLFGTRTWGGLVGISGNPGLVDGGSIAVPTFGFYRTNGNWGIEGHGVDPDVEVIDDPAKMQDGGDPQIDAAVAHLLEQLKTNAYQPPHRPNSPDRRGMGIPPEQR